MTQALCATAGPCVLPPIYLSALKATIKAMEERVGSHGLFRGTDDPLVLTKEGIALGKLYLLGQEVPQDREAAVHWFTLAAEQDNQHAQYFLAHMNDAPSIFSSATQLLHHMQGKRMKNKRLY